MREECVDLMVLEMLERQEEAVLRQDLQTDLASQLGSRYLRTDW